MLEEQVKEVNKFAKTHLGLYRNQREYQDLIKDPRRPWEAEVARDPDEDVPADYHYEEEIWPHAAKAEQGQQDPRRPVDLVAPRSVR